MNDVDQLVEDYSEEAKIDYLGLWQIAYRFQLIDNTQSVPEIKGRNFSRYS